MRSCQDLAGTSARGTVRPPPWPGPQPSCTQLCHEQHSRPHSKLAIGNFSSKQARTTPGTLSQQLSATRQAAHGRTLDVPARALPAVLPMQRSQRGLAQPPSWCAAPDAAAARQPGRQAAGRHRGRRCRSSDDPGLSARGSGLAVSVAGGT